MRAIWSTHWSELKSPGVDLSAWSSKTVPLILWPSSRSYRQDDSLAVGAGYATTLWSSSMNTSMTEGMWKPLPTAQLAILSASAALMLSV